MIQEESNQRQWVAMAETAGQEVQTTLLEGKPFQRILEHGQDRKPSLLVVGRFGLHRTEDSDIGSTSENLARLARCSVLVVSGELSPSRDEGLAAGESLEVTWTDEAVAGLRRVPSFARGMAKQAVEEYARESGHREVTAQVLAEARQQMGM